MAAIANERSALHRWEKIAMSRNKQAPKLFFSLIFAPLRLGKCSSLTSNLEYL
jgi:hypothetical protein